MTAADSFGNVGAASCARIYVYAILKRWKGQGKVGKGRSGRRINEAGLSVQEMLEYYDELTAGLPNETCKIPHWQRRC